jgi:hypothetical protein
VNGVIGRSKAEMTAAEAPVRDTPLLDFIAWVQAEAVRKALAGSASDEIRNLMIGWVQGTGEIDPAEFASVDWKLTRDGVPVF